MEPTNVQLHEVVHANGQLVCTGWPEITQAASGTMSRKIMENISQGGRVFLMEWAGSKIPHNAEIVGYRILWTQNSYVTAEKLALRGHDSPTIPIGGNMANLITAHHRTDIGTYWRLETFGGANKCHHKMIILLEPGLK